jgi:aspartate carbamoyltransferase catalytic subunit
MKTNPFFKRDLLSTSAMTVDEVELVLHMTDHLQTATPTLHPRTVIASCFFEPSTRTRLSFESAALRLGAKIIGFSSDEGLSIKKGETLTDTMRVIDGFADLIILRHSAEGAATLAAEVAACPVINAGDGANQHPTQALLDLYTIKACQHKLHGLSIAIVGDLKYGRTVHSLIDLCSLFDMRLYFVSPEMLSLPDALCDILKQRSVRFSFHTLLEEVINKIDVLYMTRIQQERFGQADYQLIKNQFVLTSDLLKHTKSNLKILHPLPRVHEIAPEVDHTPYAFYFQQAKYGPLVRQAILSLILNESLS